MKERPILFSASMVRAILAGTKTQTRRIAKILRVDDHPQMAGLQIATFANGAQAWLDSQRDHPAHVSRFCPYGAPGDRLRVKEAAWMWCERCPNGVTKTGRKRWEYVPLRAAPVHYVADGDPRPSVDLASPETGNAWGWRYKAARFLPSWASRITLEVIDVRVERLQDISEADARAEGIPHHAASPSDMCRFTFRQLWESINGLDSWTASPWVWVVGFKKAAGGEG